MKNLLIGSLASIGVFVAVHGCRSMAKPMRPGAALYSRKCSSCHSLIEPSRFDRMTWHHYVEKYGERLTLEQKQQLLYYLTDSMQE
ncbi:MAG: cytochrome c [Phycisphaerales bacterium]|nr:MAG: cytochrome c [Phycisphaerales bacterium]